MSRFILAFALLLAAAPQAQAAFRICNKTAHAVSTALGHYDGKDWVSEGWWTVAPGGCEYLLKGDLIARYYYLHAVHHDVGGGWDGDRGFCVAEGRFRVDGRADCSKRGYGRKGFFEIDTRESLDWTQNLAD